MASISDDEPTNGAQRRDSQRFSRPMREEDADEPAQPPRRARMPLPDFDAKTWMIIIVSVLGVLTGNGDKLLGGDTKAEIEEAAILKKEVRDLVEDMKAVKTDVGSMKTSVSNINTILDERLPEPKPKKGRGQ